MKREERRHQILERARDVFAEKGYHAATVEDIVARASIARGTFYSYFDDKRAIFEELVDRFSARIAAAVSAIDVASPKPPLLQLRDNITRVLELSLADRNMTRVLLGHAEGLDAAFDRKLRAFYGALEELIGSSLEEGQKLALVRPGDRRVMTVMGLGALKELILREVSGSEEADPCHLTNEVMRFLGGALLSPEAVFDGAISGRGA